MVSLIRLPRISRRQINDGAIEIRIPVVDGVIPIKEGNAVARDLKTVLEKVIHSRSTQLGRL